MKTAEEIILGMEYKSCLLTIQDAVKACKAYHSQFSIGGEEGFKEWWKKEMGEVIFQPNDTLHKTIKSAFIVGFAYSGEGIRQWISVDKELPKVGEWYLGYIHLIKGKRHVEWLVFLDSTTDGIPMWLVQEGDLPNNCTVTHWMPLPEPPK